MEQSLKVNQIRRRILKSRAFEKPAMACLLSVSLTKNLCETYNFAEVAEIFRQVSSSPRYFVIREITRFCERVI